MSSCPSEDSTTAACEEVPVDKILGSLGRYRDFDRAFLPIQTRTKARWISIDRAHYEEIILPPVELYQIGEVYFVRDGNHRVSVARERGQTYIDAFVTEIDTPVLLTPDTKVDDLALKKEQAQFILKTHIDELRPEAKIELTVPGLYARLLEHIAVHRWYLGEQRKASVPYKEAVASWYDNVYMPLIEGIREQGLLKAFPRSSEADLYLWVVEYQGYLREAFKDGTDTRAAREEAAEQLKEEYPQPVVKKLANALGRMDWLTDYILQQEKNAFLESTKLKELRPEAEIETSLPGDYGILREHIAVHRWYMGEKREAEVPFPEAAVSWYDNVYLPLVEIIREQNILKDFPGRSETDLYLWLIEQREKLRQIYGNEVSIDEATEQVVEKRGKGKAK